MNVPTDIFQPLVIIRTRVNKYKSSHVFTYVSSRALSSSEVGSLGKTILFAETISYHAANLKNLFFRRKCLTLINVFLRP